MGLHRTLGGTHTEGKKRNVECRVLVVACFLPAGYIPVLATFSVGHSKRVVECNLSPLKIGSASSSQLPAEWDGLFLVLELQTGTGGTAVR